MKRILFLMAAMTVMFASCQKSMDGSTAVRSADSEIRLKLNVKSPTKAFTASTAEVLKTNGFKVAAVKENHSELFNDVVKFNTADGTFSVQGKHYFFPTEGALSFYAVYPAEQTITVSRTDGTATIDYIQDEDTDLVAAKAVDVASTNDPVLMTFSHLLSQVSVKAQGTDPAYTYKLKSVTITDAESGTYSFADGIWTPGTTTQGYDVFTATDESGKDISTSALEAVGSAMSFIPGDVKIKAVWSAQKGSDTPIENDVTVDASLEQGKSVTLNLFLPADPDKAGEIFFMCEVGAWTPSSGDVIVKKPYEPELIEGGVFTVDNNGTDSDTDDDKKVKFTKGNLYWNGKEFRCEENQYDYPTAWAVNHVGHFYWSKDARVAYAENYNDANTLYSITPATGDTFFAFDGGAITGFTVLSKEEWQYLIDHALVRDSDKPKVVTINDKKCVILKPDGFSDTVADSYTAADWATAEASGLVALPFAGYRGGTGFSNAGSYGDFWSTSPFGSDVAWGADFFSDYAGTNGDYRYYGRCVRLVSVQNSL